MKKLFILLAVAMLGMSHNAQAQSLQQFHNAFMNYAANSWANYQNQMMQNAWQMQQRQQQLQQQWANEANWDNVNNYNYNNSTSTYQQNNSTNSHKIKRSTFVTCDECNGSGHYTRDMYMGGGVIRKVKFTCSNCNGLGKVYR
jgi:DnaJ-class molecular chaperone